MLIEDLITSLQECDVDEECYIRINGVFYEIDDVYGVADVNYYVIDICDEV